MSRAPHEALGALTGWPYALASRAGGLGGESPRPTWPGRAGIGVGAMAIARVDREVAR